jgi:hypothetical protein
LAGYDEYWESLMMAVAMLIQQSVAHGKYGQSVMANMASPMT